MDSQNDKTVYCPFCKEEIKDGAIKCKHCGSHLVPISENSGSNGSSNTIQIVNSHGGDGVNGDKRFVEPGVIPESYVGHGWGIVALSFLFVIFSASTIETEPDASLGMVIFGAVFVIPWSIWVLRKKNSNKVLPWIGIILLIFTALSCIGSLPE